jgi:hypothetical protein
MFLYAQVGAFTVSVQEDKDSWADNPNIGANTLDVMFTSWSPLCPVSSGDFEHLVDYDDFIIPSARGYGTPEKPERHDALWRAVYVDNVGEMEALILEVCDTSFSDEHAVDKADEDYDQRVRDYAQWERHWNTMEHYVCFYVDVTRDSSGALHLSLGEPYEGRDVSSVDDLPIPQALIRLRRSLGPPAVIERHVEKRFRAWEKYLTNKVYAFQVALDGEVVEASEGFYDENLCLADGIKTAALYDQAARCVTYNALALRHPHVLQGADASLEALVRGLQQR